MADDRIFVHSGTLAAFLAIARRVRASLGYPRCNCQLHGGTGRMWKPCTCTGPTGLQVDRQCPHVTLRPTRVVRHPVTPGLRGILVTDDVFAALTAGEQTAVESITAEWEAAGVLDDQ